MRHYKIILTGLIVTGCLGTSLRADDKKPVDFAHDVVPVLKKHCIGCHGGKKAEGGFSLNTRALVLDDEAVVPGKSAQSRLIELIRSTDSEEQMPPKEKSRLSAAEISLLTAWVDGGLRWEQGFTFAPERYEPPLRPRRPKLPPAVQGRTNPIDRILDAYLISHKVNPRPAIDDSGYIRRLSLDLLGLLPKPNDLSRFVADSDRDKRRRLVLDTLSKDQQYAEHWMTFWSDLLRNAYSGAGYIDGGRKQVTLWLYRSLLENKHYDQFVRELIAPTAESEGFIRGIKWRGNVNASQKREIQFTQSVSQVLLGINMKCASCHDSFIDRWKLDEAYGLAAIYATGPLEIYRCDKPTGRMAKPAWIFPELGQIDPKAPQPERLKQLSALMTHPGNGRLTRTVANRLWCQLMGRGIVHPVDAMGTEPWSADLLDFLGSYLADEKYDLKKLIALIVSSEAYRSKAVVLPADPGSEAFIYSGPIVKRLTSEQFLDAIHTITLTWPKPDGRAFKRDGRSQGGQLAAVLKAHGADARDPKTEWNDRPIRSVFTPLDSLQATLGRPNREQVVTSRPSQLTTFEAITLINGDALSATLRQGAARLMKDNAPMDDAVIKRLYLHALCRLPTDGEQQIARGLLGSPPTPEGTEDLLWTLFMLPEFQFIR